MVGSQPSNAMPAARRMTLRPPSQRLAVAQVQVDACLVLPEPGNLAAAIDRYAELTDPVGQQALDVFLPERQAIGMARREIADVEVHRAEAMDLRGVAGIEEALDHAALVEQLEGARMQPSRARAIDVRRQPPLDDRDIDPGQLQLGRQHHARRPTASDHHLMLDHPKTLRAR